jgi:glucose/arabinose dehydrogenase
MPSTRTRLLALASGFLACAQVVRATGVPTGFVDEPVVSGLNQPTAIAFAPDGRLFICEQGGKLRVAKFDSGTGVWSLLPTPFLQLAVDSSGERGLLGVAFHPSFASNKTLYVYHTVAGSPAHNRVSEYTANGDVATGGSSTPTEVVGFDIDDLTSATNHNGGAMHFGADGKLYVAVGDNATGLAAPVAATSPPQTLDNLLGKILRLNSDLTIPTDNPFYGSTTGNDRAIWVLGLRNPFTFSVNPDTGRIFVNDVGQDTWEEINDGIAASNFGWPVVEGPNPPAQSGKTYAQLCYAHSSGTTLPVGTCGAGTTGTNGCAITGGSFPRSTTPTAFDGDYYFSDYCGGWIKAFHIGAQAPAVDFASGISSPVDLNFHTDGRLYYLGRGAGGSTDGFVRRITYTASAAPTITDPPKSLTVSDGHDATFTVGASGAQPLSYQWQRDNVDIGGATGSTFTLQGAQIATDNGAKFHCTVTNAYGSVPSADATLTVTADQPPVPKILTPSATLLYTDGMLIKYSGSAADKEDGAIKNGAQFTWQVDFHHDAHVHPFVQATPGATSGSFVVNSQGHTESDVWLRLILTVTDSGHHSTTVYRDIFPKKVQVTVKTDPPGLGFLLDGQPFTSTTTFTGVTGILRSLSAVAPQSFHHALYDFWSWSDGGGLGHSVKTPAVNTTYVVSYRNRKTGPRSTP